MREVKGTGKRGEAQAKIRHSTQGVFHLHHLQIPGTREPMKTLRKGNAYYIPTSDQPLTFQRGTGLGSYSLIVHGPMDVSVFSKRSSALQTDRRNPWACYLSASLYFFFFLATLRSKWDPRPGTERTPCVGSSES